MSNVVAVNCAADIFGGFAAVTEGVWGLVSSHLTHFNVKLPRTTQSQEIQSYKSNLQIKKTKLVLNY